jgi:integral membrane protein
MSYVVGTMLLVMVCLGLPLQYAWNHAYLASIGWTVHGGLYAVYLLSAADLARRARFTTWQVVGVVTAGFLPGLAFAVERRTVARILGPPLPKS